METSNRTILSFDEFIKMGDSQDQRNSEMPMDTEIGQEDMPVAGEEPETDLTVVDKEISAAEEMPTGADSEDAQVNMTNSETGEATANAPMVDANVMIDN